jgi:hypothetical protein
MAPRQMPKQQVDLRKKVQNRTEMFFQQQRAQVPPPASPNLGPNIDEAMKRKHAKQQAILKKQMQDRMA